MDESLDEYISKANFKVQIGNTNLKGNRNNPGNKRTFGFQPNKGVPQQIAPLQDVSITVPSVQKTSGNINRTNQIRDARDKIGVKGKPQDARQKIQVRAKPNDTQDARLKIQVKGKGNDARQKLTMIRSQKTGPQDARAKLQAKKQQIEHTVTGSDGFMLTRTVSNSHNIQMAPQAHPGNIKINKTLTKIMPPGYEGLVEGQPAQRPLIHTEQTRPNVKQRLGHGPRMKGLVNVTRTVPSNLPPPGHDPHRPPFVDQRPPAPHFQQPVVLSQPHQFSPNTLPVRYAPPPMHYAGEAPPPHHMQPPGQVQYVHPPNVRHPGPPPQHYMPPPPHHMPPPPQVIPQSPHAPPPQHPPPPRMIMTQQIEQPRRSEGPPYPVDDNIPIKRTVAQEIQRQVPVIRVENDQYRPQPQQFIHYAPPTQPYPPPQQTYTYPDPASQPIVVHQQQPYYTQTDSSLQRTVPSTEPSLAGSFVKTIKNESAQNSLSSETVAPLKRKSPGGPLRLSSTNTIPVLASADYKEVEPPRSNIRRTTKPVPQVSDEPVIKKSKPEVVDDSDVISPIQGFKIVITNLHVTVSQDDVIELFGAVGAVKKVKLVKPGTAEVTYVKKDDAIEATSTYNERELDGQPMGVKLMTPLTARVKEVPEKLPPSVKPASTGPLKLNKKPAGMAKVSEKKSVDVGVLHKALFKTGSSNSSKPVTFTVNI